MNTQSIDAIARAVLYEGYMLYPYRPSSVKNRQRFNFGVLYPRPYSEAQSGEDAWSMQTECLVEASDRTTIKISVRFLKLVDRSVWKLKEPAQDRDGDESRGFEPVTTLEVDGKTFAVWQEAIECEVAVPPTNLVMLEAPLEWPFAIPAKEEPEHLYDANGRLAGMIFRRQELVRGVVEISAERVADGIFKLQVKVKNLTAFAPPGEDHAGERSRNRALTHSLVSAHFVLGAVDGEFVSLLEPPENLHELAAACQNIGAWPVLVAGDERDNSARTRDTMLASPIILYDYPQIAPESPGDLFDGTEIDEILALRILTMTDDEKSEMRGTDDRARRILERTESLPVEHLMKLHGTMRELYPADRWRADRSSVDAWKEEMP
ncbi:MAG: hypothetical protein ABSG02_04180 [Terriglobales bacterium]|jgi:hypothetical protein